jgi:hypothetical protein
MSVDLLVKNASIVVWHALGRKHRYLSREHKAQ